MLDIINDWKINQPIPETYRGQPADWYQSPFSSSKNAKTEMNKLIAGLAQKTKWIIVSYFNRGLIPLDEFEVMLNQYGTVEKQFVNHAIYNRYIGIAKYKREVQETETKEVIYIVELNQATVELNQPTVELNQATV